MDKSNKTKWEIFAISSLILPMPYFAVMAAGTMPLLAYFIGSIYSLLTLDPDGIFIAIFLIINSFFLLFICKYLTKLILLIKKSKIKYGVIFIVFIWLAFIPWHWAIGVNKPKSFNTFQFYNYVYKSL